MINVCITTAQLCNIRERHLLFHNLVINLIYRRRQVGVKAGNLRNQVNHDKICDKKNHPPEGRWLQISYLIPLLK